MRLMTKETPLQTITKVYFFFCLLHYRPTRGLVLEALAQLGYTGCRSVPRSQLPLAGTVAREALELNM